MDRIAALEAGIVIFIVTALISIIASRRSERLARRLGVLDQPTGGRKIHTAPTPLWGGVGVVFAIIIVSLVLFPFVSGTDVRVEQLIGYLVGVAILLVGGMIDDARPLPPRIQIIFPILAAIAVIVTGTGIVQVTDPFHHGALTLVWWQWKAGIFGAHLRMSLPSDLLTFVWIVVATYAMKILDGLDGLVAGMTVIGAAIVGGLSLSIAYFQPSVALFSAIVGGAYFGFLPRNMNPAKQFLGESGSTIAGFSLGVLAILSGAKIAVALSVLAIPIADIAVVIVGRASRGAPWFHGDATHLHHRLIQAGLSQRFAVFLYWGVALLAGILALSLQTRGKIFLIIFLCILAVFASVVAGVKARRS